MRFTLFPFTLCVVTLITAWPATGQIPDRLEQSIFDPTMILESGGQQGRSVAVDGNLAVVGIPFDVSAGDSSGGNYGAVRVYDVTTGALLHTLLNPDVNSSSKLGGNFGISVAISGTRVVVGAYEVDTSNSAVYVYDLASGNPRTPIAVLQNPNSNAPFKGGFGYSVAISGPWVAVGAYRDGPSLSSPGTVYVYNNPLGSAPAPTRVINSPVTTSTSFGYSVATSGTRLVVGAYLNDTGAMDAGVAYVYDMSGATPTVPVHTLNNPSPAAADHFGWSVAISGTRVAVGVYRDDTGVHNAGIAYIYNLAGATPTVPTATLLNPTPADSDYFGYSVAFSGTRVAIGTPNDDTNATDAGSAYIYDIASVTPTVPIATLNNPGPAAADTFGTAVAISGTRVLIGAPLDDTRAVDAGSAYIYDLAGASPTLPIATVNETSLKMNARLGTSVALSGTTLAVGASKDSTTGIYAGRVYVYDLENAAPVVPILALNNPSPSAITVFGSRVAALGSRVFVGAPETTYSSGGKVYVYDLSGPTPSTPFFFLSRPAPSSGNFFGDAIAVFGNLLVVGAPLENVASQPGSGAAYVYDLSSATPNVPVFILNNPNSAHPNYDYFGTAVAISGMRIVVGASGKEVDGGIEDVGAAYVFDLASLTPTVPVLTLENPGAEPLNDSFGAAVAISGTAVVVGAPLADTPTWYAGDAYVYDLASGTPTVPVAVISNPSPSSYDSFGAAIVMSGTRIVVGATKDETAGSVFVYDLSSPMPTKPVASLKNPTPQDGDIFGSSIALDGTTVIVGAPKDDTTGVDRGAVYIYRPSPYSEWKATQVGDQFASDLGDGDGDGLGNLGEYGLLRSPTAPEGATTNAGAAVYTEGLRLRMFVPRDPARNDITLEVQAAGNVVGPWTTIATSALGTPFVGPGYFSGDSPTPGLKLVEVRDTMNISAAPQRFLRVRVRH